MRHHVVHDVLEVRVLRHARDKSERATEFIEENVEVAVRDLAVAVAVDQLEDVLVFHLGLVPRVRDVALEGDALLSRVHLREHLPHFVVFAAVL